MKDTSYYYARLEHCLRNDKMQGRLFKQGMAELRIAVYGKKSTPRNQAAIARFRQDLLIKQASAGAVSRGQALVLIAMDHFCGAMLLLGKTWTSKAYTEMEKRMDEWGSSPDTEEELLRWD